MPVLVSDRTRETSTDTGTGAFALDGAPTGFRTFVQEIGDGNQCLYAIVHDTINEWEVGLATVNSGSPDTLTRDVIYRNSSGGTSAISFSSGNKTVFVTNAALNCTTPWIKYVDGGTSDGTFTTNTTYNLWYRRTGVDTIEIAGQITFQGAPTPSTTLGVDFPSGLTFDSSNWPSSAEVPVGHMEMDDSGADFLLGYVYVSVGVSATQLQVATFLQTSTYISRTHITPTAPITIANGDAVKFVTGPIRVTGLAAL